MWHALRMRTGDADMGRDGWTVVVGRIQVFVPDKKEVEAFPDPSHKHCGCR